MEKRALVTGADGFAGPWLVRELETNGYEVWTASRREGPGRHLRLDVTDATGVREALARARPDVVFHLASLTFVPASWERPEEYFRVNVGGTLNLLEAIRLDAPSTRFVFAGSSEVYGFTIEQQKPLTEESLCQPASPYGVTKLAADLLALDWQRKHGVHTVRLRLFNHTGPGQRDDFVLPSFASQIARAEAGQRDRALRVGNLDVVRTFTDVRDVARAYRLAAERGRAGACYNVGRHPGHRVGDLLDRLLSMAKVPMTVAIDERRLRSGEVATVACDPARFQEDTGWEPAIPMEVTLEDLLRHWRDAVRGGAGGT